MKVLLRIFLTFLGLIILASVGGLLALQSYLRTPAGSDFLLTKLKVGLAEKANVRFEYRKASFDPFSRVHFEGIRITRKEGAELFEFRARSVDLQYSFQILSKIVWIKTFQVDGPSLIYHSTLSTDLPAGSPPVSGSEAPDFSKWIESPPVQLNAEKFAITGLSLDIERKTPGEKLEFKLNDASVDFSFKGSPNHLALSGGLSAAQEGKFSLESSHRLPQSGQTECRGKFSGSARFSLGIRNEDASWIYEVQPSQLKLGLTDVFASKMEGSTWSQLVLQNLEIESDGTLTAKSHRLFELEQKSFERLESNHRITTGSLSLERFNGKDKEAAQLKSQKALLRVTLDEKIKLNLEYVLNQLESRAYLVKPVQVKFQTSGELERDLSALKIQGTAELNQARLFNFGGQSPLSGVLKYQGSLKNPNTLSQITGDAQIDLSAQIPTGHISGLPRLTGVKASAWTSIQEKSRFTLKDFRAELCSGKCSLPSGAPALGSVRAEATGDTSIGNFQAQGEMSVYLPKDYSLTPHHKMKGKINFPWTLTLYRNKDIGFEGQVIVTDLDWSQTPSHSAPSALKVQGISGSLPLSEQWVWDGKRAKFSHLINQNPFERVDFERLQPMIHESERVVVQKIGVEEKEYGPFEGYFSVRQNMIFAHKFDLNLGSGRTNGEFYLDAYPKNLQLGILARMTGINLSEVLPQKYLLNASGGNEKVSGRSGLVISLNSGSIDGRVDVTEIGKKQLLTLINLMDPRYENEKMNNARFALGIADPSSIQMSFQKGFMDMGFQLNGGLDFMFRGIPISSWVSSAKSERAQKEGTSE